MSNNHNQFCAARLLLGFGCLVAGCLPWPALADSVILHPVADTTLFSTYANNNLGASPMLVAGANASDLPRRALIRFDPASQIPSNAKIQSVALTLKVVAEPASPTPSSFDLRRMLVDWGEGKGTGKSGVLAKNGEATWEARFYPTNLWSQPGAAASIDFSALVSASTHIGGLGTYTFSSTTNLVSDVQQWLSNPATNFGWILLSESESTPYTVQRFASREDTLNTPSLQVQYVAAEPPRIVGIDVAGNSFQITFVAVAGQPYTVEYRDSLNSGAWSSLTNLPPQSITTNQIVSDPILANPHRYYRIGTSL